MLIYGFISSLAGSHTYRQFDLTTTYVRSSTCKNTFIVKDFVAYNILKITYHEAFYGVAFLAQSPSSHVYPAGQAEQAGPDW